MRSEAFETLRMLLRLGPRVEWFEELFDQENPVALLGEQALLDGLDCHAVAALAGYVNSDPWSPLGLVRDAECQLGVDPPTDVEVLRGVLAYLVGHVTGRTFPPERGAAMISDICEELDWEQDSTTFRELAWEWERQRWGAWDGVVDPETGYEGLTATAKLPQVEEEIIEAARELLARRS